MVVIGDFASKVSDVLYFGKYPTQDECNVLSYEGFVLWVDLMFPEETKGWTDLYIPPPGIKLIKCPMKDRTPESKDERLFSRTISIIVDACLRKEKVYVQCRGGHGRSAVVAAICLCIIEGIEPRIALQRVKLAHNNRKIMEPRWRTMGAPQTRSQKQFVLNYDFSKHQNIPLIYDIDTDGYYVVEFE